MLAPAVLRGEEERTLHSLLNGGVTSPAPARDLRDQRYHPDGEKQPNPRSNRIDAHKPQNP
jgi:hypothetical protein